MELSERGFDRDGTLLAALGQPAAAEVVRLMSEWGVTSGEVHLQQLGHKHTMYRVGVTAHGRTTSLVAKRLDLDAARRIRLVTRRWLPRLGLRDIAPRILGAVAAADADWVWHLYEDAGDETLHAYRSDRDRVAAAVDLAAELHTRAAEHPSVVAECRRDGHDLGMHFFMTSVTDGLNLLEALERSPRSRTPGQAKIQERLRRRLDELLDDAPRRARAMENAGVPVTMLHGDLWTTNILLGDGRCTGLRLVDWDRVGAGHVSYDLSSLLYRFPAGQRTWILDRYRGAVARAGWHLGSVPELNLLFDTAECARYAYRISWPAVALLQDGAEWGFTELREIDGWFQSLEPAIPE